MARRRSILLALCAVSLAGGGCGDSKVSSETPSTPKIVTPMIPEEDTGAAKAALGDDAVVLLFGPLAGEGTNQVVAINRLGSAAGTIVTGTAVSRVSILSKDNGSWHEVLRVDEYLKNPNGFLRGTPASAVAGWRIEERPATSLGTVLLFTPLAPDAAAKNGPIAVAWNPKAKRYQSLDQSGRHFLRESSALETAKFRLK